MAKKKKKQSKVKRLVGSTPMEVLKDASSSAAAAPAPAAMKSDSMDTSEIVVTESMDISKKLKLSAGSSRPIKKGPLKRKAAKLRKEKALKKAMSMVEKQEQRVMKKELKSFRVQTLKKMDIND